MKKRVLFLAEAATLAHVARPAILAGALDPANYEVCLAADSRYDFLFSESRVRRLPLKSISSEQFLAALEKGAPLYDRGTLQSYVEADLALIEKVDPDLVVGDFRLSLSVSARLAKVPYMTVSNVYWSPYAKQSYTVPELPLVRFLGVGLAQKVFDLVRPTAFALHAHPLNQVRKHYGLPSLGRDLTRTYTDADAVIYADVPGLVATRELPQNHRFVGPVMWSPASELPGWWGDLDPNRPIVYINLGSSGNGKLLPVILEAMASLPVQSIVATTGVKGLPGNHGNIYLADFLPGDKAAAAASLVICNGGSPTAYQALANGCPVIGIPGNLDQYLNMAGMQQQGLGIYLRSGKLSVPNLRNAVRRLLDDPSWSETAKKMQGMLAHWQADQVFPAIIRDWTDAENTH